MTSVSFTFAVALAALLAAGPARADGAAPPAKDETAIRGLFPDAERIEPRDVILNDDLVARIERLARAKVKERFVTFYAVQKSGQVIGYAVIHSHVVRTKRETLAIAFEPDGRIRRIQILSFLEPGEYKPTDRWLAQLQGKGTQDPVQVGNDLAPITGATLSARGIAEESRFLLAALREAALPKP